MESNDRLDEPFVMRDTRLMLGATGAEIGTLTDADAEWHVRDFLTPRVHLLLLAEAVGTRVFARWILHVLTVPADESHLGVPLWTSTAHAISLAYSTRDGMPLHHFMMRYKKTLFDIAYSNLFESMSKSTAEFLLPFVCRAPTPYYCSDLEGALATCMDMDRADRDAVLKSARNLFKADTVWQIVAVYARFAYIDEWADQEHPWTLITPRQAVVAWVASWGFEVTAGIQEALDMADEMFIDTRVAMTVRSMRLTAPAFQVVVAKVVAIEGAPEDDVITEEDMEQVHKRARKQ